MNEEIELEFEQPLEDEDELFVIPASKRKLFTEQGDPEIESLYGKFKGGRLTTQPDLDISSNAPCSPSGLYACAEKKLTQRRTS
ncbi:MAG TPA: hypothetical protein VHU19_06265 [Pyrinomonadaceae bacterium]|jgi:hypothetical protein|nr:hypothetical protein [Pyrinomonadaceae bacterium]